MGEGGGLGGRTSYSPKWGQQKASVLQQRFCTVFYSQNISKLSMKGGGEEEGGGGSGLLDPSPNSAPTRDILYLRIQIYILSYPCTKRQNLHHSLKMDYSIHMSTCSSYASPWYENHLKLLWRQRHSLDICYLFPFLQLKRVLTVCDFAITLNNGHGPVKCTGVLMVKIVKLVFHWRH